MPWPFLRPHSTCPVVVPSDALLSRKYRQTQGLLLNHTMVCWLDRLRKLHAGVSMLSMFWFLLKNKNNTENPEYMNVVLSEASGSLGHQISLRSSKGNWAAGVTKVLGKLRVEHTCTPRKLPYSTFMQIQRYIHKTSLHSIHPGGSV